MRQSLERLETGALIATGAITVGAVAIEGAKLVKRAIHDHQRSEIPQKPIVHDIFVSGQDSGDFGFGDLHPEYTKID